MPIERRELPARGLPARAWWIAALGGLAFLGLVGLLLWVGEGSLAAATSGSPRFEDLLVLTAVLAAWLVSGWLFVAVLASALASASGALGLRAKQASQLLAPAFIRRLTAALLGAAIAAAPVVAGGPAQAVLVVTAPSSVADAGHPRGDPAQFVLDRPLATARPQPGPGGPAGAAAGFAQSAWTPDRPVGPARVQASPEAVGLVSPSPRPEHAVAEEVVVRSGDTLWDIVARHLGPGATAAEVAVEWPRWHAANRAVVGADPGLILPGQVLAAPG